MLTVDIDSNSGFCAGVIRAISTAEELLALMGKDASGNYFLANDIDMSDYDYTAEGATYTTQSSITSFSGVFDGNGYTISGLSTTNGLFAAATNAEIFSAASILDISLL